MTNHEFQRGWDAAADFFAKIDRQKCDRIRAKIHQQNIQTATELGILPDGATTTNEATNEQSSNRKNRRVQCVNHAEYRDRLSTEIRSD